MDFKSLQQLDAISSKNIENSEDANAYVTKAAVLCGITDSSPLPKGFESRLATAELEASRDPDKLVSDANVAEAFNFLSDQFGVPHPVHLAEAGVLQYRAVMSAVFPHIFSPKNITGSRPAGTMVMLWMLVYNGGITESVKKAAQLDRPPGTVVLAARSRYEIRTATLVAKVTFYRIDALSAVAHINALFRTDRRRQE